MILRTFQRGLDRVLLGMVCAQPGAQQFPNAFGIWLHGRCLATDYSPTDAPSRGQVILGESAKRNHGHVRRHGREGDVLVVIQN